MHSSIAFVVLSFATPRTAGDVQFTRDVQPILAANCIECHGAKKQKAGLRLDNSKDAMAGARFGADPVIVPKSSATSELYLRLVTTNEDDRMPSDRDPLSAHDIEVLRQWIDDGAKWADAGGETAAPAKKHWAYETPIRPPVPTPREKQWVANPIDAFVLAKLESEKLAHAPKVDRATLMRRVSLDLVGLPPTVEELDRFLADASPNAYEKLVDRLLASPQFGENWAAWWLDLARYADTNGYEKDDRRVMWRWRDWVIDAFNRDEPFDRFSTEQLAGDLLPNATPEQKLATGFHRNTMINEEGGVDPEEFRVAAVVDRVNTTSSVWLGSTLGCAQCHNHKYDPFTQRDYYAMLAYFNSTADVGNSREPKLVVPTTEQAAELARLQADVERVRTKLDRPDDELDRAQEEWESEVRASIAPPPTWRVAAPVGWSAMNRTKLTRLADDSLLASGPNPRTEVFDVSFEPHAKRVTALRLELLTDPSLPAGGPGRSEAGNCVISELEVTVGSRSDPAKNERIAIAGIAADHSQRGGEMYGGFDADRAIDGKRETSWAAGAFERPGGRELELAFAAPIELAEDSLVHLRIRQQSQFERHTPGRIRVSFTDDAPIATRLSPIAFDAWRRVGPFAFEAPATREAMDAAFALVFEPEKELAAEHFSESYASAALAWRDESAWKDGEVHALDSKVGSYYLTRTFHVPSDRRSTFYFGSDDALKVWLDGAPIVTDPTARGVAADQDRAEVELKAGDHRLVAKVVNFAGPDGFFFRAAADSERSLTEALMRALHTELSLRDAEQTRSLREYFRRNIDPHGRELFASLSEAEGKVTNLTTSLPATMVQSELDTPRETHIFTRGDFRNPGEKVEPATPAVLPPPPNDAPKNRLGLARWLFDPKNPLVARVAVNRLWERIFGVGIVVSSEDFGTRGEPPTDPELLDWLATEFVARGWSMKSMLRLMVTSSTYAQTSNVSAAEFERDPQNRSCARASRWRVDAEKVRDVELSISGLLDPKIGGPSVFPYQPPGIWNLPYNGDQWVESQGGDRHRRGLYTFARRSSPYPTFNMFDAPTRELVCTRRSRSNTPLQALALLNDPVFVEASGAFAKRMLSAKVDGDAARTTFGFRACTARKPDAKELALLAELLASERARFAADRDAAAKFVVASGSGDGAGFDVVELAAWTSIANALLNLDETITKS